MTVSGTIEMKTRERQGSSAPADAAGQLLGVRPAGEMESNRFGTLVHWAYGTGWGATRGILAALGLPAPAANAAHLALVWGAGQVILPALQVAPPATQWGVKNYANVSGIGPEMHPGTRTNLTRQGPFRSYRG